MNKQEMKDFAMKYPDVPGARDKDTGWCFVRKNGSVQVFKDLEGKTFKNLARKALEEAGFDPALAGV